MVHFNLFSDIETVEMDKSIWLRNCPHARNAIHNLQVQKKSQIHSIFLKSLSLSGFPGKAMLIRI